jgi:hypothetical protein
MRNLATLHRDERGMSIIELLIASAIGLMVITAGLEFYVSQHKSWLMQTDVAEIQYNARACIDEIANSLRMAGYDLPAGHESVQIGTDSLTVFFVRAGKVDTIRYFIYKHDSEDRYLVRHVNDEQAKFFSNDVESLIATETSPRRFTIELTTRSERPDKDLIGLDGYRRRTITTEVLARNLTL